MGYTIKQKIEICLQSEANPQMTQIDLANWAMQRYGSDKPPAQTTISRILSSKDAILGSKDADFQLVRRRKQSNPLLRRILTEWITQAHWEKIPTTTPIIQLTANAIWNRLPTALKDGNGVFNHKWCNHFVKRLNINLTGSPAAVKENMGYKLNKVWQLDEKLELKAYIRWLIAEKNYSPRDLFTIDEFPLFYCLPLDQIFDVSSIDKGLKQLSSSTENILTILLGCNLDGSEKLNPLVVSKHETFDVTASSHPAFKTQTTGSQISAQTLINKISEVYQISYKSNSNKWITSSMFQDYLLSLDHKIDNATPDRQIVIFLDNSSSHRMINLEFKHIKLVYMENATKHKNPYNGSANAVKFDYLPMSFGIVEEFKILYRLQQYLEMINKQRNHNSDSEGNSPMSRSAVINMRANGDPTEVLAEADYQVPFIRVIEWIKRSWDSISPQKIFVSWKRTYILSLKAEWPATDRAVVEEAAKIITPFMSSIQSYNSHKSYDKLQEIMNYLNVVIPWEIDDLLGLVNERSKVSLNYVSIEEIIGSCLLSRQEEAADEPFSEEPSAANRTSSPWFEETSTLNAPLPQFSPNAPTPKLLESVLQPPEPPLSPQLALKDLGSDGLSPNPAPPQMQPLSHFAAPSPYQAIPNTGPLPHMRPHARNTDYGDYSTSSPNSMSMNALLLATNVSKSTDSQLPTNMMPTIQKEVLPPMLKKDSNLVRRFINEYSPLPEPKRRNTTGANSPLAVSPYPSVLPDLVPVDMLGLKFSRADPLAVSDPIMDEELITLLRKVIDASKNNGIKLSNLALEELKFNLSNIQQKLTQSNIL